MNLFMAWRVHRGFTVKSFPGIGCILLVSCLIVITGGCDMLVKPPTEPRLHELSDREGLQYEWTDDLDFTDIDQSVEQSIGYYEKVAAGTVFRYGGEVYTAQEMAASHRLFLSLVKDFAGMDLVRSLREKFIFFESGNAHGGAFFTGYYEPFLQGSLDPTAEFTEPLYETPGDLIVVDLGMFSREWKQRSIVGRLDGGRLVPYDSREEIVYGNSLENRARPLAYVREIELFFLQIQGSGLIGLPDGRVTRVNYAQKNGHPYVSIGSVLRDKIPSERMSLQAIKAYLHEHPEEVRDILSLNPSYTFFREVEDGPLGNIGVVLTPNRSIAMDSALIPGGGLAFIETELPVFEDCELTGWRPVRRFVLVQDTGGAIRGHGRVDLFFGHGPKAELTAGHMIRAGRVFLMVAKKKYIGDKEDKEGE